MSDAKFFETDINRKRTPTSITKVKEIFADKLSIQQNCHFFKLRFVLSQSTTYSTYRHVVAKWLVCSHFVFLLLVRIHLEDFCFCIFAKKFACVPNICFQLFKKLYFVFFMLKFINLIFFNLQIHSWNKIKKN